MGFVDLERAYNRVPLGVLWGVLREYGVSGPLLRVKVNLHEFTMLIDFNIHVLKLC